MRLILTICFLFTHFVFAGELPPDERAERNWKPAYLSQATGVFAKRSKRSQAKIWPVKVLSIGHTIASYQNYGDGQPYFHEGLDIRADAGSDVVAAVGGKVLGVNHYMAGSAYWEVAIQDDDGFIWQYHHVDHDSVTPAVYDALHNGTRLAEGTKIGEVYYWEVVSFGERYNHIHLNVLGKNKQILNGFAFLPPLADTVGPQIVDIGLLQNGEKVEGNSVSGKYTLYAQINDLILSKVFIVPPHQITIAIDNKDPQVVWSFDSLPGGDSEMKFVEDFWVPSLACGDYDCRRPVLDLGFSVTPHQIFPTTPGPHTVHVGASDYAGNATEREFSYTVR